MGSDKENLGEYILKDSEKRYKEILKEKKIKIDSEYTNLKICDTPFDNVKQKGFRRYYHNKPYSSYTATDWWIFSVANYKNIFSETYPGYPRVNKLDRNIVLDTVYQSLFNNLKWSARDFARFLLHRMYNAKKRGLKFDLSELKSFRMKKIFFNFDKKLKEHRNNSYYEEIIYFPHIPLSGDEYDLIKIYNNLTFKQEGFLCCYGLPIFHKIIQISEKKTFDESTEKIRFFLKKIVKEYANDEESLFLILSEIAKNSIMWGPYSCDRITEKAIVPQKISLDWQVEFEKLWEKTKVNQNEWWVPVGYTKKFKMLHPVYDLFNTIELI